MARDEQPLNPERIDAWIDQFSPPSHALTASEPATPEQHLMADLQAVHQGEPPLARSLARVRERLAQSKDSTANHSSEPLRLPEQQVIHPQPLRQPGARVPAEPARPPLEHARLMPRDKGETLMRRRQIGGVAAIITLVAVVALLVVLLHQAAPGHSTGRAGSSGTPQSSPNPSSTSAGGTATVLPVPPGQWTPVAGLMNTTAQIMFAPSNPKIVYEDLTPPGTGTSLSLQRSDDDGATWHALAQPAGMPSNFDETSIVVSPLDPNTIIVTLTIYAGAHPADCPASGARNALYSGGPSCDIQFYSSDGGQHWSRLSLPVPGALGAPFVASLTLPTGPEVLRPQGQRLYSAISNYSTVDNVAFGGPNVRIIASDDGGKTWQLVDGSLTASNQNTCDFAPTSSGQTIYAITQTSNCYTDQQAATFLWRSDDGGAHWTQAGKLPGSAASMVLVNRAGAAVPLIYVHTPAFTIPSGQAGAQIAFSQDGGKTWQPAPNAGLPDNPASDRGGGTGGPLAVLSDGSVVEVFPTQDNTVVFAAWKIGESAWHAVAPVLQGTHYLDSCFTTSGANGKAIFWIIAQETSGSSVFRYIQQ